MFQSSTTCSISRLLVLPLLALPLLGFGQGTRKITVSHHGPDSKEVYYTLKSDAKVRHGSYELYGGRRRQLATTGYYTNGQKDSIWTSYGEDGKTVLARGAYRHDQRVGVWEVYNYKGEPVEKYDFTNRILVFSQLAPPVGSESYKVILHEPTADGQTKPELEPLYIGGANALFSHLAAIRFPAAAIRSRVRGKVWIGFTIDADGNASSYRVVQGIGSGCDEEALRVVKSIPSNWLPAQVAGRPVTVDFAMPVTFAVM
ncbi:energy transducer TonB [Hymenobacter lucidus]|uniref:TonB family protein n=1 Tax=Hymenobacter lucidus TaxID=2880930 RepID=A0ABS8AM15_9BACT|nr:energy transducer TonB [Hymenobacter lucidus]MCB2406841.1 TonB family protein [Hymenobacter lucidus]